MTQRNDDIANLSDVIRQGVKSAVVNLHTSLPGRIISFDPVLQTATVALGVKRVFINRGVELDVLTAVDLPPIVDVPVIFPRGGGFSLTFPVMPDDECLVTFCERSIDRWHQSGNAEDPTSRRFHALTDAVCMVGLSSIPNKVPDFNATQLEIKSNNGNGVINVSDDGTIDLTSAADVNINTEGSVNITSAADVNILAIGLVDVTATGPVNMTAAAITITGPTTIAGPLVVTGPISTPTVAAAISLTVAGTEMAAHTHVGSPSAPSGSVSNTGIPI